ATFFIMLNIPLIVQPYNFHCVYFFLSGGSSAFSDRSHSIFDCLDSVDQQTSSSLSQESTTDRLFTQPPFPSRKTSHLSSNCPIPPKKRGVPDYLVHPEKWTRYSLEDVTETSDQDNQPRGNPHCTGRTLRAVGEHPHWDVKVARQQC
uniref:U5 small nuclear ribonucleoprotein TSSC4 n=1 Tax=Stegastes partitus TaxID=144197 RepID=A0A3B5AT09_9TELE